MGGGLKQTAGYHALLKIWLDSYKIIQLNLFGCTNCTFFLTQGTQVPIPNTGSLFLLFAAIGYFFLNLDMYYKLCN